MHRACKLARRGEGFVEPNPMVGAVVAKADGTVLGEGWHKHFGSAHAEVHALAMAGEAARDATLFVTLEPCCHTGKTPPCTDAILRAGIRRVVVAATDPFPAVAGKSIAILEKAGLQVDVGLLEHHHSVDVLSWLLTQTQARCICVRRPRGRRLRVIAFTFC